jgi:hypothetical protein
LKKNHFFFQLLFQNSFIFTSYCSCSRRNMLVHVAICFKCRDMFIHIMNWMTSHDVIIFLILKIFNFFFSHSNMHIHVMMWMTSHDIVIFLKKIFWIFYLIPYAMMWWQQWRQDFFLRGFFLLNHLHYYINGII